MTALSPQKGSVADEKRITKILGDAKQERLNLEKCFEDQDGEKFEGKWDPVDDADNAELLVAKFVKRLKNLCPTAINGAAWNLRREARQHYSTKRNKRARDSFNDRDVKRNLDRNCKTLLTTVLCKHWEEINGDSTKLKDQKEWRRAHNGLQFQLRMQMCSQLREDGGKKFELGRHKDHLITICSFLANDLWGHPWDKRYYHQLIKEKYGAQCEDVELEFADNFGLLASESEGSDSCQEYNGEIDGPARPLGEVRSYDMAVLQSAREGNTAESNGSGMRPPFRERQRHGNRDNSKAECSCGAKEDCVDQLEGRPESRHVREQGQASRANSETGSIGPVAPRVAKGTHASHEVSSKGAPQRDHASRANSTRPPKAEHSQHRRPAGTFKEPGQQRHRAERNADNCSHRECEPADSRGGDRMRFRQGEASRHRADSAAWKREESRYQSGAVARGRDMRQQDRSRAGISGQRPAASGYTSKTSDIQHSLSQRIGSGAAPLLRNKPAATNIPRHQRLMAPGVVKNLEKHKSNKLVLAAKKYAGDEVSSRIRVKGKHSRHRKAKDVVPKDPPPPVDNTPIAVRNSRQLAINTPIAASPPVAPSPMESDLASGDIGGTSVKKAATPAVGAEKPPPGRKLTFGGPVAFGSQEFPVPMESAFQSKVMGSEDADLGPSLPAAPLANTWLCNAGKKRTAAWVPSLSAVQERPSGDLLPIPSLPLAEQIGAAQGSQILEAGTKDPDANQDENHKMPSEQATKELPESASETEPATPKPAAKTQETAKGQRQGTPKNQSTRSKPLTKHVPHSPGSALKTKPDAAIPSKTFTVHKSKGPDGKLIPYLKDTSRPHEGPLVGNALVPAKVQRDSAECSPQAEASPGNAPVDAAQKGATALGPGSHPACCNAPSPAHGSPQMTDDCQGSIRASGQQATNSDSFKPAPDPSANQPQTPVAQVGTATRPILKSRDLKRSATQTRAVLAQIYPTDAAHCAEAHPGEDRQQADAEADNIATAEQDATHESSLQPQTGSEDPYAFPAGSDSQQIPKARSAAGLKARGTARKSTTTRTNAGSQKKPAQRKGSGVAATKQRGLPAPRQLEPEKLGSPHDKVAQPSGKWDLPDSPSKNQPASDRRPIRGAIPAGQARGHRKSRKPEEETETAERLPSSSNGDCAQELPASGLDTNEELCQNKPVTRAKGKSNAAKSRAQATSKPGRTSGKAKRSQKGQADALPDEEAQPLHEQAIPPDEQAVPMQKSDKPSHENIPAEHEQETVTSVLSDHEGGDCAEDTAGAPKTSKKTSRAQAKVPQPCDVPNSGVRTRTAAKKDDQQKEHEGQVDADVPATTRAKKRTRAQAESVPVTAPAPPLRTRSKKAKPEASQPDPETQRSSGLQDAVIQEAEETSACPREGFEIEDRTAPPPKAASKKGKGKNKKKAKAGTVKGSAKEQGLGVKRKKIDKKSAQNKAVKAPEQGSPQQEARVTRSRGAATTKPTSTEGGDDRKPAKAKTKDTKLPKNAERHDSEENRLLASASQRPVAFAKAVSDCDSGEELQERAASGIPSAEATVNAATEEELQSESPGQAEALLCPEAENPVWQKVCSARPLCEDEDDIGENPLDVIPGLLEKFAPSTETEQEVSTQESPATISIPPPSSHDILIPDSEPPASVPPSAPAGTSSQPRAPPSIPGFSRSSWKKLQPTVRPEASGHKVALWQQPENGKDPKTATVPQHDGIHKPTPKRDTRAKRRRKSLKQ